MAVIAAGLGTPWLWSLVVTGSTVFAGGSLGVMRGASLIFTHGFLNLWILSTENKLPYVNRWFQACIISEGDKIFPTFYRAVAPGDEECSRSIDLFYMCLSCSSFSIKLIPRSEPVQKGSHVYQSGTLCTLERLLLAEILELGKAFLYFYLLFQ